METASTYVGCLTSFYLQYEQTHLGSFATETSPNYDLDHKVQLKGNLYRITEIIHHPSIMNQGHEMSVYLIYERPL